jgi:hypothetical protein
MIYGPVHQSADAACATPDSLDWADSQDYSLDALLSPTRLCMGVTSGLIFGRVGSPSDEI